MMGTKDGREGGEEERRSKQGKGVRGEKVSPLLAFLFTPKFDAFIPRCGKHELLSVLGSRTGNESSSAEEIDNFEQM